MDKITRDRCRWWRSKLEGKILVVPMVYCGQELGTWIGADKLNESFGKHVRRSHVRIPGHHHCFALRTAYRNAKMKREMSRCRLISAPARIWQIIFWMRKQSDTCTRGHIWIGIHFISNDFNMFRAKSAKANFFARLLLHFYYMGTIYLCHDHQFLCCLNKLCEMGKVNADNEKAEWSNNKKTANKKN